MSSSAAFEGFLPTGHGRVWYRILGDRAGGAVPLLVVHGGPGLPSDYMEPLAALAAERPVVFYDQLGCGRSDRPTAPGPWTLEYFVGELRQVRQEALGKERVHLLGHSTGTQLLLDYVLTRPGEVASLVLLSPIVSLPRWREDAARLRARLPEEVRATLARLEAEGRADSAEYSAAARPYYARHVCRIDPWPEPLQRALETYNDEVYRALWGPNELNVTGSLRDYDRAARLPEIAAAVQRTLFLCGRDDESTPEAAAWYQSLLPGSELAVVEEASHMPHLERPAEILAAVRGFLARADAAA